jgi:hypothetical protein
VCQDSSETGKHPGRSLVEFEYRAIFLNLLITAPGGVIWHVSGSNDPTGYTHILYCKTRKEGIHQLRYLREGSPEGLIRSHQNVRKLSFQLPLARLMSLLPTGLCFILYALCYPLLLVSYLPVFLKN